MTLDEANDWRRNWLTVPRANVRPLTDDQVAAVLVQDPHCAADAIFQRTCAKCRAALVSARLGVASAA